MTFILYSAPPTRRGVRPTKTNAPHIDSERGAALVGPRARIYMSAARFTLPTVHPSKETVVAFWHRVAELSARSRTKEGRWIGSREVVKWNKANTKKCLRCSTSKTWKQCTADDDHPGCRACRIAKVACDRKLKFLYDCTKIQYFPSWELFLHVYTAGNPAHSRSFQKAANRRRHEQIIQDAADPYVALQVAEEENRKLREQLQINGLGGGQLIV
ncbi:hypothetical protein DFH06DRAFT_1142112 [Mycena polygramma]|nr:hypothetical protein DFH06DRAFT_1144436 [Mycena polygramma]KAJ7626396.1 hypothetical protein DFH06DRAFT_1142112 [Mycena polygramma]